MNKEIKKLMFHIFMEFVVALTVLIAWSVCLQIPIHNIWFLFILYPVHNFIQRMVHTKLTKSNSDKKLIDFGNFVIDKYNVSIQFITQRDVDDFQKIK